MRLAIPFAVLLAATTAPREGCGSGTATTVPAYDACAGKTCGDSCTACPPDDRDCVETAVLKACDPSGRCVAQVDGMCGAPPDPCSGKACGAACTVEPPCRSATPPCMVPSLAGFCDASGSCVAGTQPPDCAPPPPPPPSWGCMGKKCGDSCGVCPEGTDPKYCPVPTFAATACDARLQCVTAGTFTCPATDPCAGKACGADCDPCGGLCMYPARTSCDYAGRCVVWSEWLCYDPCDGKACGAECNPCPPDVACVAIVSACDAGGACSPVPVTCGP